MPSSRPRAAEIRTALNRSVIPEVDLENVSAEDALKYWDETSTSYDPRHFKFMHVISYPMTYGVQPAAPGATHSAFELGSKAGNRPVAGTAPVQHKITVRRKNITAKRLLDEICQQANLVWTIMGREIVIKPKPPSSDAQP